MSLYRLTDLINYKSEILKNMTAKAYEDPPLATNYYFRTTTLHNGIVYSEVCEVNKTLHESGSPLRAHLTMHNPPSDCYVQLTERQKEELLPKKLIS